MQYLGFHATDLDEIFTSYPKYCKESGKNIYLDIDAQGMESQGAFFGKGIKSHFKTLQKCDNDILTAFTNFGDQLSVPEDLIHQMERYICLLYANCCDKSIQDIRYSMSVINGRDSKSLPPTTGTLVPHVFRAYYSALLSKAPVLFPEIPTPTDYYWHLDDDNTFQPVMCINDAIPPSLSNFKKCGCKGKTKRCTKESCTCFKFSLKCTDLCGCGDFCENREDEDMVWEVGIDDLDWDGSI